MNSQILLSAGAIPAIVGLVEVAKSLGLPIRAAPAAAILFGILEALAQLYANHLAWIPAVTTGIALGLAAAGLYSGTQTFIVTSHEPSAIKPERTALHSASARNRPPDPESPWQQ